eukprot:PhM_4_TR2526/c0_g1_i1/m.39550
MKAKSKQWRLNCCGTCRRWMQWDWTSCVDCLTFPNSSTENANITSRPLALSSGRLSSLPYVCVQMGAVLRWKMMCGRRVFVDVMYIQTVHESYFSTNDLGDCVLSSITKRFNSKNKG